MHRDCAEVLDQLLVLRSQDGDTKALGALVERWHGRLLRHALRLTADREAARDVAQEVWLAVAQGIVRLEDPARFHGWLYRILVNKSRDWIRREQAGRRAMRRAVALSNQTLPDVRAEVETGVQTALRMLPPEEQTMLSWYYLEELSVREIAAALSIPEGTVKSRLSRTRNALRICLEQRRHHEAER